MKEFEFRKKWTEEKPVYKAWGDFVVNKVLEILKDSQIDAGSFFKVPPGRRLKDDGSLIDKAFYRPGKNYSDPYEQIEDKVGARFVVLLLDDIKKICDVIDGCASWEAERCKHFDEDRENDPLLFTYQSVHYVLRPTSNIKFNGVEIPADTPCEVQVRTLLQHAHAELTHDAIYKSKKTVRPMVHRTVAKSMALIETTDDFFVDVTKQLNFGPLEEYSISERLDGVYYSLANIKPHNQKSSIVIWDSFEQFLDNELVDDIASLIEKNPHIEDSIKSGYMKNNIYQQSVVLFVYWLLKKKKRRLLRDWPLPKNTLEPLANDMGVSIWDE